MAEELDDATWAALDAPAAAAPADGHGLGMLLKMTRLHDLGLAQLLAPELALDEEEAFPDSRDGWMEREGLFGSRLTRVHSLGT